jgi:hypothetical protein
LDSDRQVAVATTTGLTDRALVDRAEPDKAQVDRALRAQPGRAQVDNGVWVVDNRVPVVRVVRLAELAVRLVVEREDRADGDNHDSRRGVERRARQRSSGWDG